MLLTLVAGMVLFALATAWALDRHGRRARVFLPPGPSGEPPLAAMVLDDPVAVYRWWRELGVAGRIVLYAGDRWSSLVPPQLELPLENAAYPMAVVNPAAVIEREQLTADTFLYVASRTGVARRVDALLSPEGFREMRAVAADARNAAVEPDRLFMTSNGFPRTFYHSAGLRTAGEPVLLYVGASWFRTGTAEELGRALTRAGMRADVVAICLERNDASLPPAARDALVRFAREAGLVSGG